ncbi:5633_t:CDS:2 [Gigaspora margarita]|uniref:5633_t:CDS:1 n=1 Tax=Gigaspora margarita TaxID=4874 RepID=A0ABN7V8R5_GIGMA|nr:5633_t:CDS:2 [Gigaspora margarita]
MNQYLILIVAFVGYILYKYYIYPLYLSPLCKIPGPPVNNFVLGHYASFLSKGFSDAIVHLAKQYVLVNHCYDYPKEFLNSSTIAKEIFGKGIILQLSSLYLLKKLITIIIFNDCDLFDFKEMVPTFIQASNKLKDIWMKQIESELAEAYDSFVGCFSPLYMALMGLFPFIRKLPIDLNNRYFGSIKVIHNFSKKLVAERKTALIKGKDLLSLLVKANEKFPVDQQLTNNELIGQIMTILIAGHETTSNALSWVLYFLAKHSDTQDHLRKEVLDIFTNSNHFPTFDEIEHLKYLDCIFRETLRIVPPKIKSKISSNNFLPFGASPASCLGMKIAQLEFKSILPIIIRSFEFKLVDDFTFKKNAHITIKANPGIDLWVSRVDY